MIMKRAKRLLVSLICCTMLFGMMTGCGNQAAGNEEAAKVTITFSSGSYNVVVNS